VHVLELGPVVQTLRYFARAAHDAKFDIETWFARQTGRGVIVMHAGRRYP